MERGFASSTSVTRFETGRELFQSSGTVIADFGARGRKKRRRKTKHKNNDKEGVGKVGLQEGTFLERRRRNRRIRRLIGGDFNELYIVIEGVNAMDLDLYAIPRGRNATGTEGDGGFPTQV